MKWKWINLAVRANFSWPNAQVEIPFEGRKVVLQPFTGELSCTVSVFDDAGLTFEEGGTALSRFLSRLAWSMNGGVVELFIGSTNDPARPGRMGQGNYVTSWWAAVDPWDNLYLPSASDAKADLALALFREGMSVNSVPFAFLSYFKVLNIMFSAGQPQKDWINANHAKIWYQPAVDRIHELAKSQADLGAYLYKQGRCAVAHAYGKRLVNLDNYGDKRRLELDLPLMKEIAGLFIEQELGVLRDSAFWKYLRATSAILPEWLIKTETADGRIVYISASSHFPPL